MNADKHLKEIAWKQVQSIENFIGLLVKMHSLTKDNATKVFKVYKKVKVIQIDYVNVNYRVKHGAYLDRDIVMNAVNYTGKY